MGSETIGDLTFRVRNGRRDGYGEIVSHDGCVVATVTRRFVSPHNLAETDHARMAKLGMMLAAAPSLLAACEAVEDDLAAMSHIADAARFLDETVPKWMETLRAAIQKTRGGA